MKNICYTFSLWLLAGSVYAQQVANPALKKELDSIFLVDQQCRKIFSTGLLSEKPDSLAAAYGVKPSDLQLFLINKMNTADSSNMRRIEAIIRQYGYPGKSLVGAPANEAAFFVIQHSKSIDKYLSLIKKVVEAKELNFALYAMMLDRSRMYNGKEQLYGTQGTGIQVLNKTTGQKEFIMIIWPIKDEKNVNSRRKKAGFKETVEENSKRLGIEYKPYTLAMINQMTAN